LEALQEHENVDLYNKAVHLLETYFAAEEDDQNIAPNVTANANGQQAFTFGFSNVPLPTPTSGGFNFSF